MLVKPRCTVPCVPQFPYLSNDNTGLSSEVLRNPLTANLCL